MKRSKKIALTIGPVALLATATVYLLFRGYLDPGHFEVLNAVTSPTGKVVMVAKRYDDQSLGGLEYFVVIGDHTYSPQELRLAFHSPDVVFSAMATCITTAWGSASQLTIDCNYGTIPAQNINVERHQFRGITIIYQNISPQTANDSIRSHDS